jgi:hypothetical protein
MIQPEIFRRRYDTNVDRSHYGSKAPTVTITVLIVVSYLLLYHEILHVEYIQALYCNWYLYSIDKGGRINFCFILDNVLAAPMTIMSTYESGRFGALKSDSTHYFLRNACTKSGSLHFSQFSVVD